MDTADIQAEVWDVPLVHPPLRHWLCEHIAAGEAKLASPGWGENNAKAQDD